MAGELIKRYKRSSGSGEVLSTSRIRREQVTRISRRALADQFAEIYAKWSGTLVKLRAARNRVAKAPPVMGSDWQAGQLRHFDKLIADLVAREPKKQ